MDSLSSYKFLGFTTLILVIFLRRSGQNNFDFLQSYRIHINYCIIGIYVIEIQLMSVCVKPFDLLS